MIRTMKPYNQYLMYCGLLWVCIYQLSACSIELKSEEGDQFSVTLTG